MVRRLSIPEDHNSVQKWNSILDQEIMEKKSNEVIAIASKHWTHLQHDQKMGGGRQENQIRSCLQSMVKRRRSHKVEMEMALPEAEDRRKNTNSRQSEATMSIGLPEEDMGENHTCLE